MNIFAQIEEINWTAFAGFTSFLMVIITGIALWQNHRQLKEIRRQWNANNRPHISANFTSYKKHIFLQIQNYGTVSAKDVEITLDQDYINNLLSKDITNRFNDLTQCKFAILPNQSKYFFVCGKITTNPINVSGMNIISAWENNEWFNKYKDTPLAITIKYSSIYEYKDSLQISQYLLDSAYIVNDELTDAVLEVSKELSKISQKETSTIQSKDMMSQRIPEINMPNSND